MRTNLISPKKIKNQQSDLQIRHVTESTHNKKGLRRTRPQVITDFLLLRVNGSFPPHSSCLLYCMWYSGQSKDSSYFLKNSLLFWLPAYCPSARFPSWLMYWGYLPHSTWNLPGAENQYPLQTLNHWTTREVLLCMFKLNGVVSIIKCLLIILH